MKAVVLDKFGDSSVLKIANVEDPIPSKNECLIKIHYASVNPVDRKIREGLLTGLLPHQFPITPGWDFSGEVLEVGSEVKNFKKGDLVYSFSRFDTVQKGAYAEQITVPENFVALKPKNLNMELSASVPLVALTAYQVIHECFKVQAGNSVFINAAAGGVGAYAVQFAKLAGAKVFGGASAENHSYVKELGADHVVDYKKHCLVSEAKSLHPEGFDCIFDCVGGKDLEEANLLKHRNSKFCSIVQPSEYGPFHFVYPNANQLADIAKLFENGSLLIPSIEVMNIKDAAKAQDLNERGGRRGKIVLDLSF